MALGTGALDAHVPLIVILENGFQPMYKPPGKYFEACADGLLLMLAPWPNIQGRKVLADFDYSSFCTTKLRDLGEKGDVADYIIHVGMDNL